jgi:hypothetical protein
VVKLFFQKIIFSSILFKGKFEISEQFLRFNKNSTFRKRITQYNKTRELNVLSSQILSTIQGLSEIIDESS